MIQVNGEEAYRHRQPIHDPEDKSVLTHWRVGFIGSRADGAVKDGAQAFVIELAPNRVLPPHFHEVDQFQVFTEGSGQIGRNGEPSDALLVHYADRYTGYGPVIATERGYSYYTLRPKTDSGAVYIHEPGYREKLKPSKKRHFSQTITLSTEAVLENLATERTEDLISDPKGGGSLHASLHRLGPNMAKQGPDPAATGGQFYLFVSGSGLVQQQSYPSRSLFHVASADKPLQITAGAKGLEFLILQFDAQ